MTEVGWLIERRLDGRAVWLTCRHVGDSWIDIRDWTTNASLAIRFARKVDAERAMRDLGLDWVSAVATEHVWG